MAYDCTVLDTNIYIYASEGLGMQSILDMALCSDWREASNFKS